MYAVPPQNFKAIFEIVYYNQLLYMPMATFTKLSILHFYLRLFEQGAFPALRTVVYAAMAVTAAWGIGFAVPLVVLCRPVSYFWDGWAQPLPHTGTCININAYAWGNSVSAVALDLWLIMIPFPHLAKLTLPWRKKLEVLAMFGLSFL
jgi:hypothetical protein